MNDSAPPASDHREWTRRGFLQLGAIGAAALGIPQREARPGLAPPELTRAIDALEPYFTSQDQFRDVSRGKPVPHSLSDERKGQVGLTRETWRLEVVPDPDHPATLS